MIYKNTIISALSTVEALSSKRKLLVPKNNSIVAELTTQSMLAGSLLTETDLDDYSNISQFAESVEQNTTGTLEDPGMHTCMIDSSVKALADMVNIHVSLAKNEIYPIVDKYAESIKLFLEANKDLDPGLRFNIDICDIPPLLENESFLDSIKNFIDEPIFKPKTVVHFDQKSNEDILALMLTGSSRVDKMIGEWVSKQDPEFLTGIWNGFFTNVNIKDIITYENVDKMNIFDRANVLLVVYLLARKLFDDPEELAGISLSRYNDAMVDLRNYSGAYLTATASLINKTIKNNTLVTELNSLTNTIKVVGNIYRPWLEKGGNPDVLLGLLISDKNARTVDKINDISDSLVKTWTSYRSFAIVKESNILFDGYKRVLKEQFDILYNNNITSIEQEYTTANPECYIKMNSELAKYIETLKPVDMDDVYKVSLKIIAGIRFSYTSSFEILSDIHEAGILNPQIDPREAATIAVINYLTDYMLGQLQVVNE